MDINVPPSELPFPFPLAPFPLRWNAPGTGEVIRRIFAIQYGVGGSAARNPPYGAATFLPSRNGDLMLDPCAAGTGTASKGRARYEPNAALAGTLSAASVGKSVSATTQRTPVAPLARRSEERPSHFGLSRWNAAPLWRPRPTAADGTG